MQPYISFVVCTRNDDYAGGLAKCYWGIRYLAEQCDEFGLDAELVLVEWNPPADRESLALALRDLPPSKNLGIRVLTVSPKFHNRYQYADRRQIHAAVAANVGIRRAQGRFRVFKVADAYYQDSVIRQIALRQLARGRLYRLERWDVAETASQWLGRSRTDFLAQCASAVRARNKHLPQPWMPFSLPDLFTNASGDFQLLAAEDWQKLRGYTESSDVTSFEVDSMLEYSAYALGIIEERLKRDAAILKIEHGASHLHRVGEERNWISSTMLNFEKMIRWAPFGAARHFWLRALFNYPAKTYSGVRKSVYERSVLRYKLLSMVPQLTGLKSEHWGLAGELLPEVVLNRAAWEQR
jgi:hypothetical protein